MSDSENSFDYLPYFAQGEVVNGFGRGGSELGIPTANFSNELVQKFPADFVCGVYYGWACVDTLNPSNVYKMVMCVGWNTHFNNTVKTVETHILHKFENDFYGENLRIIILGYIRPMRAFNSIDELIVAMNTDIQYAKTTLDQPSLFEFSRHPMLTSSGIKESVIPCLHPHSISQQSSSHQSSCVKYSKLSNNLVMQVNKEHSENYDNENQKFVSAHLQNGENSMSHSVNDSSSSPALILNGASKHKIKSKTENGVGYITNGHVI